MRTDPFYTIYVLTILVFLPVLVVQTRVLLSKRLRPGYDSRRPLFDVLLEELPHDLAIIGMTLAFASFALLEKEQHETTRSLRIIIAMLPFLPFSLMSVLPLARSKIVRMYVGLLAYSVGVAAFLLALYIDSISEFLRIVP